MVSRLSKCLDGLDSRASWQFFCILYVVRWILLLPYYVIAEGFIFKDDAVWADMSAKFSRINPALLFAVIVVVSPLLETLFECSMPFSILSFLHRKKGKLARRPWLFIVISALLMLLLHPVLAATVPAFVSGVFLAYCYAHFAPRGFRYALMYTTAFHGAVNIVGWTMIVFGSS